MLLGASPVEDTVRPSDKKKSEYLLHPAHAAHAAHTCIDIVPPSLPSPPLSLTCACLLLCTSSESPFVPFNHTDENKQKHTHTHIRPRDGRFESKADIERASISEPGGEDDVRRHVKQKRGGGGGMHATYCRRVESTRGTVWYM